MNRDLIHFLRLGLMRVRHRTSELTREAAAGAKAVPKAGPTAGTENEIETLLILEDLILEQVPHENIDHSAR
jgi:hypothetical protein